MLTSLHELMENNVLKNLKLSPLENLKFDGIFSITITISTRGTRDTRDHDCLTEEAVKHFLKSP